MPHSRRRVLKTSGIAAGALAGGFIGLDDLWAQPGGAPSARTIDTSVLRVGYVESGNPQGFPIVLLHGWPETWWEWRQIIPRLAETNTVIVPDMRGMGASTKAWHSSTR